MSTGTFGRVHFLRRQRRFALGEFPSPSIGAFEDFESRRLDFGGPERGWATNGVVYTYAALEAFEDFETSTVTSTVLPVFGWSGDGFVTAPMISSNPTNIAAPPGVTVSFSVIVIDGVTPYTYQWRKAGINLSNGGTVSGATTATLTLTGIGSGDFSTYDCVVTDALSRTATSSAASLVDLVTDWVSRVVANGGATPSIGTQTALNTFVNGLVSDGTFSLMLPTNCFVPDSLIAAITPLIVGSGLDPWTNTNFVSADLTVNGLAGNASNKYLQTGFNPFTLGLSNLSVAFYAYAPGAAGIDLSCQTSLSGPFFQSIAKYSDGNTYLYDNANGIGVASPGAGFYAQTRASSIDHRAWFANSGNAFAQIGSTDTATFGAYPNAACFAFANNSSGSPAGYSASRLSFGAFTKQATSTQMGNIFTRAQALRVSLGGGYI